MTTTLPELFLTVRGEEPALQEGNPHRFQIVWAGPEVERVRHFLQSYGLPGSRSRKGRHRRLGERNDVGEIGAASTPRSSSMHASNCCQAERI
jgi:hypothetical protein